MAYQIYIRGMACGCRGLVKGKCKVVHAGAITMSSYDLVAMQAKDEIIVEVDPELGRIMFRPPADVHESADAFDLKWNKVRSTARINCGGAIRMLGLDPEVVKGSYELLENGRRRELIFGVPRADQVVAKKRGRKSKA